MLELELNWYPKTSKFYTPFKAGSELDHLAFAVGKRKCGKDIPKFGEKKRRSGCITRGSKGDYRCLCERPGRELHRALGMGKRELIFSQLKHIFKLLLLRKTPYTPSPRSCLINRRKKLCYNVFRNFSLGVVYLSLYKYLVIGYL
jgi:hypothetical protein